NIALTSSSAQARPNRLAPVMGNWMSGSGAWSRLAISSGTTSLVASSSPSWALAAPASMGELAAAPAPTAANFRKLRRDGLTALFPSSGGVSIDMGSSSTTGDLVLAPHHRIGHRLE